MATNWHQFTESVPCFQSSEAVSSDIALYNERVACWDEMTRYAADLSSERYNRARARFTELAKLPARGAA